MLRELEVEGIARAGTFYFRYDLVSGRRFQDVRGCTF